MKLANRLGPMFGFEPNGEIHYNRRKEAPFEKTEHESQEIELALGIRSQVIPMAGDRAEPWPSLGLGQWRQPAKKRSE
jgi:hypothetical protein